MITAKQHSNRELIQKLQHHLEQRVQKDKFSGAVLLAKDPSRTESKGSGWFSIGTPSVTIPEHHPSLKFGGNQICAQIRPACISMNRAA